jgi:DNA-binding MarR family transcriptional regulator
MGRGGRSDERHDQQPRQEYLRPTEPLPKAVRDRDVRDSSRHRQSQYRPNESELRTLATVGSFRIVPVRDLSAVRGRAQDAANVRRLLQAGLLERQSLTIAGRSTPVVALTGEGLRVLEGGHREEHEARRQEYHAGFVKPREATHDAQLHAVYEAEAKRIEAEGGRSLRVVLDYEIKRDYQAYLNRTDRPKGETLKDAREAFAAASRLPVVDGHLELPDLRIEYETADGRLDVRDLELITEHYSRSQLAGKAKAGFTAYRTGSKAAGGNARTGGTPYDPHYLEWLG